MPNLIMMMGLPRSGKSTKAREISKKHSAPIVCPDSIRLALTGQRFYKDAEPTVWATAKLMVRSLFLSGHEKVILDATNTTHKGRLDWRSPEWVVYVCEVKTSVTLCVQRAIQAGQYDLISVIDRMQESYDYLTVEEFSYHS